MSSGIDSSVSIQLRQITHVEYLALHYRAVELCRGWVLRFFDLFRDGRMNRNS